MSRTSESLAPDRQLINIHQPDEAGAWSRSLGCSEEALRAAVQAVGHSAQAVRSYLSHRGDAGAGTGSAQAPGTARSGIGMPTPGITTSTACGTIPAAC